jgi:GNAT superfamily N-acetyltransferase
MEEGNGKLFKAIVRQSNISPDWKGTGLGQILYDKAIQYAKKQGCKVFSSDIQRTMEAESAWSKLSKRYPVEKSKYYYTIDLSKVSL